MSSRMFQGVLLQLSEAAQTTIGVIDAEGNVISCSDTTLIGEKWPDAATAVAAMLENPVREEPYTFYALKGWNPAYGYSAFVLGTDAQAEMLVRMTQVSLNSAKAYYEEKHDKGTFVKNIITDNILPGDILKQDMKFDSDRLDEIVDLMLETVCTARKRVRIAGDDYPAELVKSKFMKLDGEHIRFVLDCMRENTTKIRNIKQYLKAALFNAPSTIGNYYTSLVAHDMASGALSPKKPQYGDPDYYSCNEGESL